MTIWPPQRQDLKRPVYRSLADTVTQAIEVGALKPGDRLPTHRQLAYELGLSVQTISRAYEELIRRGVISGEVGRGTFVRAGQSEVGTPFLPQTQYDELIDCSILKPVLETIHLDCLRKVLAELGSDLSPTSATSSRPSTIHNLYGDTALAWLEKCGVRPPRESILLTNGNTSAMTIALMTAANPGDLIVAESLSHHTLRPLAQYLGLRLIGLEFDEEGVVPDDLARVCANHSVKAVYVMPSGLSATASMMGLDRRRALCRIARRYNVLIIENDAWGPIQPARPDPIAALAPERTFYFTSFTKCIMPGLRLGYLVVPEPLSSAAATRHLVTNWMATPILAEIASRWIADGTAEHLLEWQIAALSARNEMAAEIFANIPFNASPNGLHVWLPLPPVWREDIFEAHARLHNVAVARGSHFAVSESVISQGVRICLGTKSAADLERGLQTIAHLVRSQPEPAMLAI
ncbi:MAG: PLP-dependent aminotransferase family protein [Dichotomicrobium sp.]